jgi:hypothetical protein
MTERARRWFLGLIVVRLVLLGSAAGLAVAAAIVSTGLFLVAVAAVAIEFGLASVCRRLG